MAPRLTGLKIFWPGVETGLRLGLALAFLVAVFLPLAWAHRQHARAEGWREVACSYRLKEALRDRRVTAADLRGRPCMRLEALGFTLEPSPAGAEAAWPAASVSH
jgi:hypothetical protein